ncbi:MAG TPA: DUF3857 domain-containing protein [Anaeromyxobacteraceae bacterium]|nr:DUF3857 domain-containing protein [Anaeromyxobacteraceae bacterium]
MSHPSRAPHGRKALYLAAVLLLGLAGHAVPAGEGPSPQDPVADRAGALALELRRDHAEARALVPLIELSALEDELPDLARLALVYAATADDPQAMPEVRAYARFRLALLERSRGNLQRSAAEVGKLAFLSGWQVAGPFDNEGKRGFDEVFPPEREQDLAARFPGKAREVGWRPLPPEAMESGFAFVGAALRPAQKVVVYALTAVEAPREERVRLYLGASGAVKVFVNGALVQSDPTYHPARLDQSAVDVVLRPGVNRILVKLCHDEGRLGFFARLADLRGEPLKLAVRGPPYPPLLKPSSQRPEPVPGALAELEKRAREAASPRAASAHRDLAVVLADRRPGEDRERRAAVEARRAAELAPEDLEARLLAAQLEDDPNRRREQLEAALQAHPAAATVLNALGLLELQRGRLARAQALFERSVAQSPRFVAPRLALADLHERAGLTARALAEREAVAKSDPLDPAAVRAAARAAQARDRVGDAMLLLRKALALRFDDAGARSALVQILLERADLEGALRLLEEAQALDPADLASRLRLADLLASNGRESEAEAVYAGALRIAPEEAEILERRGQARLRAHRTQEALADFQAALELRPQNPQLKELVHAIEPAREPFEKPYLLDARALEAEAAQAKTADEDALVLGDLRVTKVFPSGLASSVSQIVVKVLTPRGVDAWRTWSTSYAPDRQELKVEHARVRKPDGAVVETFQESDQSASEPWYRLYYDARRRQLSFPALEPGDVLEIEVRTDDVASENLLADYFGEVFFMGDGPRKLNSEYVLLVPEGRPIYSSAPSPPRVLYSERLLSGGVVERRWRAGELPRLRPEPAMPGYSEVAPYVHVSTYKSWDAVARFYWDLVREQIAVTPEVKATASRVAKEALAERRAQGLPESGDELALVQAIHRFVVSNIRYVGLEFGIHGYKPYRVDQILDRRFGDCKDKASLAHALLEALGIDSDLVLLRMNRLGRMPEAPASLAIFNHAILYVPRFDLWLDETASYSGSHDLPSEDRGATVLVVKAGQPPLFTTIPEGRPEDNASESRYEVTLAADGSADVRGESRVAGAQAPGYRRAYASEHDRRALLEQAMSRAFPGLTVKEVATSDLSRLEDAVVMHFSLELPRLADREGDGLRLMPLGVSPGYVEALAPLSARTFDLVLGEPWEGRLAYRYTLPAGWVPGPLPEPVRLDRPFGAFEIDYRVQGGTLTTEARIAMKESRIAIADYPAFRDFLSKLDHALARPLHVGPASLAPPTAAR